HNCRSGKVATDVPRAGSGHSVRTEDEPGRTRNRIPPPFARLFEEEPMRSMLAAAVIVCGLAVSLLVSRSTPEVSAQGPRLTRFLPPRRFYLTTGQFNGSNVLTGCATGYHLATYWEINDPSSFVYDTARGQRSAPYQFGPPVSNIGNGLKGWMEPGLPPDSLNNCGGWTIDTAGAGAGLAVALRLPVNTGAWSG